MYTARGKISHKRVESVDETPYVDGSVHSTYGQEYKVEIDPKKENYPKSEFEAFVDESERQYLEICVARQQEPNPDMRKIVSEYLEKLVDSGCVEIDPEGLVQVLHELIYPDGESSSSDYDDEPGVPPEMEKSVILSEPVVDEPVIE